MTGLTTRPLSLDDVRAAAELLAAAEPVDDTGEHEDADGLAEWWGGELVDLEHDGRAVCSDDGRLVGWATSIVSPGVRDALRVWLEGRVHPEFRGQGIGGRLLDWQVDRGAQQHAALEPAAPARLVAHVHPTMAGLEALVRRRGFAAERYYAVMRRPLTDLPLRPPAAGVELVPFSADRDDEVRLAHNASFTEHHGSVERDEVAWRSWFTGQRAFRPELSVLALAGGAVVGYVLAYEYDADTEATGVRETRLGQIGVLPRARGRGVATAAIAAALRAAADAGCTRASLDVDTENTTGAFGLYERLGFRTDRTWTSWALPLPPQVQQRRAAQSAADRVRRMVSADQSAPAVDTALANRAHRATEPLHNHLYFAPEQDEYLTAVGVRPGRMCYFAGRAAPMGAVGPGVVTATFYNFSPTLVARLIPRAWTLASPEQVIAARLDAARASLTRLLGDAAGSPEIEELSGLLRDACSVLTPEGRPLYAGHADQPWPEEPLLQVWHGATLLREHRGDGHIAVLVRHGLSGIEALQSHSATGRGFTPAAAQALRGYTDEEWTESLARLAERGLVVDGELTGDGQRVRAEIEAETDALAVQPWAHLGAERTARVVELAKPLSARIAAAGAYPDGVFGK